MRYPYGCYCSKRKSIVMAEKIKLARDDTAGKRNFLMNVLYPVCRALGTLVGLEGEKIDDFFIDRNNRIITSSARKYRPEEVLLVFPHCIQDWECPHRIARDIRNCHNCGKCLIPDLIEIGDRYRVRMCVVGGGTAARRSVYDYMPSFVIAIACERDMISGIREAVPLPLWGILNERPNGPCRNTGVDLARVEEVLAALVDGDPQSPRHVKPEK